MSNRKALGIDYGSKRIGLSLSDDTQTIAFPFKYIPNGSLKEVIAVLEEIIFNENIGLIIIGMPLGLKGKQTGLSLKINEFVKELACVQNLDKTENPIQLVIYDERFSTVQAQKSLIGQNVKRKKRKGIVDSVASAFILQSYLDKSKKINKSQVR